MLKKNKNKPFLEKGKRVFINNTSNQKPDKIRDIDALPRVSYLNLTKFLISLNQPVVIINKLWKIKLINEAALDLLKMQSAEVTDKHIFELFPDLKNTNQQKLLISAKADKKSVCFEFYSRGLNKWIDFNVYTEKDGMIIYFQDISEKKIHQIEFSALSLASNDIIWKLDINSGKVSWIFKSKEVFGYNDQDIEPNLDWWINNVHPEESENIVKKFNEIILAPDIKNHLFQFRFRKKNGEYAYVQNQFSIIRDEVKKPTVVFGTMTDITERIISIETLNKSEKLYRELFENHPIPMWLFDDDFQIIEVNKKAVEHYGYTREEFLKMKITDIRPREDVPVLLKYLQAYKNNSAKINWSRLNTSLPKGVWRHIKKDGTIIYAYANFQFNLLFDDKSATLVSIIDITDSILKESKMLQMNIRLQTILNSSPLGILTMDKEGKIISWNYGAEKMFGWKENDIIGLVCPAVPKDRIDEFIKMISRAYKGESFSGYSAKLEKKNKKLLNANISCAPLRNDKNETIGVVSIIEDFTHRIKLEEDLKFSESELRKEKNILKSILESMSDGVVVADLTGKFLLFNKASEYFGGKRNYKMTETAWINKYGFFYPNSSKKLDVNETPLVRSINGEVLDNIDLMAKSADGKSNIFILASSRPLKDNNGNIIGALVVYHDITQRVKNEKEIKETAELLREFVNGLQNAREEERANISREIHDELGQSLTGIKIDLSSLKKKISPYNLELIERINSISESVDQTVKKIRKISSTLRPGVLDELGIVAAIEWQAMEFYQHTGIECIFKCKFTELDLEKGLSTAMFRIVQESLTNVIRHAEASQVIIKLDKDEKYLFLKIEDNGKGIIKENLSELNSIGIIGMRERILKLNGSFDILRITKSGGTRISVILPY